MKIGIIGTGAYGLALAHLANINKCDITMWTNSKEELVSLDKNRISIKLPNYSIPKNIKFTLDIKDAVINKDLIIIVTPCKFVSDASKEIAKYITKKDCICIASKGIDNKSCSFVHDVFLKNFKTVNIAVISGPSFAIDIVKNVPIGLSLATKSKIAEQKIRKVLVSDVLKLRTTKDIIGVEICGSIKNVIAIAAGMLEGMNATESTKAMFITESLNDIKNLIYSLGGNKKTILSFAGFGDLLLTCTTEKSRNFSFGKLLASNKNKNEIDKYIENTTIEGLYTLNSVYKLIKKKRVKMPIINLIRDIVLSNKEPEELLNFLIKKE